MITAAQAEAMQRKMDLSRIPKTANQACPTGEEITRLHKFVIAECERRGWHVRFSNPAKKSTVIPPGTEDFEILAPEGRTIRIECKTATGELSPEQQAYHWTASGLGHAVHICRSEAEILEVMSL